MPYEASTTVVPHGHGRHSLFEARQRLRWGDGRGPLRHVALLLKRSVTATQLTTAGGASEALDWHLIAVGRGSGHNMTPLTYWPRRREIDTEEHRSFTCYCGYFVGSSR